MVGQPTSGLPTRSRVAKGGENRVPITQHLEIGGLGRNLWNPCPVSEDVVQGDRILAVSGKFGNVLAYAVFEAQQAPFVELVNQHRGHGFRGRIEGEGRRGFEHALLHRVGLARSVAPGVPDGTMENDLALPANTHLDTGIETGLVEPPYRVPHLGHGLRPHSDLRPRASPLRTPSPLRDPVEPGKATARGASVR